MVFNQGDIMAIRRAGPFASPTDSFIDEPIPNQNTLIYPVNCADDDSSGNWLWRHFRRANNDSANESSFVGGFIDDALNGQAIAHLVLRFYYQAAEEFSMSFTYDVSATRVNNPTFGTNAFITASGATPAININDNSPGSINRSDTVTLTFEPSVKPKQVAIQVRAQSFDSGGSSSVSVSLL